MEIVEVYEDTNLSLLGWGLGLLQKIVDKHGLREGHAVLYCNRAHTKWRIVTVKYGLPHLLLPGVDREDELRGYGGVLQAYRKAKGAEDFVGKEYPGWKTRYENRRAKAAAALEVLTRKGRA